MEPQLSQRAVLTFCLGVSAVLVFGAAGFEFKMRQTSPFSRQLTCSVDANNSSQDIFSIIGLAIFDVTKNQSNIKLVSVSVIEDDLYVDHVRKGSLDVHGSISQLFADLVVTFSNQTYCVYCSYVCELNFINPAGHPVVKHSTVKSTPTGIDSSYSGLSDSVPAHLVAAVDRLTNMAGGIETSLTTLTQTLEEKLDNIADLLTKVLEDKTPETKKTCYKGMANLNLPPRIPITVVGNRSALCDTMTDGGGWVVFQRRINGDVDFYRNWTDYRSGFGQVSSGGDYWLGNDAIHELSWMGTFELRIDMEYQGQKYYAQYGKFYVGSLDTKYTLSFDDYSGDAEMTVLSK